MKKKLITPPDIEPITFKDVKDFLRVTDDAEDHLIDSLIVAAREHIESLNGRALITQTWDQYFDCWPATADGFVLAMPTLQSVTGVYYTDTDGDENTVSGSVYSVDIISIPGRVLLGYNQDWPTETLHPNNPIRIRFVCGYGAGPANVPSKVKTAMLYLVSRLFFGRLPSVEALTDDDNNAVVALMRDERIMEF